MQVRIYLMVLGVVCAVLVHTLVSGKTAAAAPPQRNCDPPRLYAAIQSPTAGSTLRGTVEILGTATLLGEMHHFELAVTAMGSEAWWTFLDMGTGDRRNASLGALDTRRLNDGLYRLRVRAVDHTSNYCEGFVSNLRIRNAPGDLEPEPTDNQSNQGTPTSLPTLPSNSATRTVTRVPTIPAVIGLPTDTPTPALSNTPFVLSSVRRTPTPISILTDLVNPSLITEKASGLVSGLSDGLILGIRIMASLVILVGIVFLLRYWL